jgi:acyl-CoA synthetase (AMP-forming)/AMP-acid ligase II
MSEPFFEALDRWGDRTVLTFPDGGAMSYLELASRVDSQASAFGQARKLVAIEAGASVHAIVCYLAALKTGHAVALLPPDAPDMTERFRAAFHPDIMCGSRDGRWRHHASVTGTTASALHPELALLLSTSGSTGVAKSVRLTADALAANARSIATALDLRADDRGALLLPLHYSYGLSVLNSHLAVGASLLVPSRSILDFGFAQDLKQYNVTNLPGVPYSYELFERINLRGADLPALRFMTVAGGRLSPALVSTYHTFLEHRGARLFVMYGQTEATARIAYVPPEQLKHHNDCIGIAVPGGILSIVDENGQEIAEAKRPGELMYRGPNIMMGYASCRDDLALGRTIDQLRTGDLAERTETGLFRIVGRLNRLSKIAGLRIAHDALEQALATRGVDAAVNGNDQTITAFFTGEDSEEHIRELLVRLTGLTALHVDARRIDRFPRLASGKVDHQALRSTPVESPAATSVRDAFRHAFFPETVGNADTFQSLGGDSLRFVELSLRLERHLGRLPDGWETQSVAELSRLQPEQSALQRIGIEIPLRAFAILLVVVHHEMLWAIPGGSALMLALVGFSMARFHRINFENGDWRAALRPLALVLMPYSTIIIGFSLSVGQIPWASLFLMGNFGFADPVERTMLPYLYWFVEIYAQIVLIFAGLSLVPWARTAVKRAPFHAGLACLAGALVLRFGLPPILEMGGRQIFTLYWNLQVVAFGWCAYFARSPAQKVLLTAIAVAVFATLGYSDGVWIGTTIKYVILTAGIMALIFLPTMLLPRALAAWLFPIAAASYHIYLFHRLVPEVVMVSLYGTDMPPQLFHTIAIVGGIAVGFLAWFAQGRMVAILADLRTTPSGPEYA